jgi:acyl dehydratase|tara:strand:- start:3879 stop:4394 length:516 start_codon:yes stop_codon:yes gene_type:complete
VTGLKVPRPHRFTIEEIPTLQGTLLGPSAFRTVSQEDVNRFADVTGDHNWIHVDDVAAKAGIFGATIVHGFLTLSLVGSFWGEIFGLDGAVMKLNYGLDRVRFPSPVRVGSSLRMHAVVTQVERISGGHRLHVTQTVEIEGESKPAVIAESLYNIYNPAGEGVSGSGITIR